MENIAFRSPGVWVHRTYTVTGALYQNLDKPSSSDFVIRNSSGYVGPRIMGNPPPIHAYNLNVQHIKLKHDATYYYSSGTVRREEAHGPGLGTTVSGVTLSPTYDWSSLEAKALDKLTDAVRGELDVSVDLAEAGKTIKMLKLTDLVVNTAKTAMSRRLGAVKALGALWLLNTYGLQPTLKSIYGLAEENLRVVINKTKRYKVRASEYYHPTHILVNAVVGPVNFEVNKGQKLKVSITYGFEIDEDDFDIARFSSLNPVSIAWELMPLSFVADWFLNVGGYLRQMETALRYRTKFRSGYKTTLVVGDLSFGLLQTQTGSNPYTSYWQGSLKNVDINRSLLTSYPMPSLPSFKANLGSSRLLSSASLLSLILKTPHVRPPKLSRKRQRQIQDNIRDMNTSFRERRGIHSPDVWGVSK